MFMKAPQRKLTTDPTCPLAGMQVLDLTRLYPGAYCTALLADLGADVIKIEAPEVGDGLRLLNRKAFPAAHVALNRGKRSMTLDLRTTEGRTVLRRLAANADVLVESHRPGLLESLTLDFESMRVENEGLVWCSITGFGPDGPRALQRGHDLSFLGISGLLSTLAVEGQPVVPGSTISLALAGLFGALGVVAAFGVRQRTGRGSRVDATMVDAAMWVIGDLLASAANAEPQVWESSARRANYRCADNRWITCTAIEPKSWVALLNAVEAPELGEPGVDDNQIRSRLTEIFAGKSAAHWVEHPGPVGGIGPVADVSDVLFDSQVSHRETLVQIDGEHRWVFANPIRINGSSGAVASHGLGPPPDLGEHTEQILSSAGFSDLEIKALRAAEIV